MAEDMDTITKGKLAKLVDMLPVWREDMNEFERSFSSGLVSRYRAFGPFTKMSVKQINTLTEIVFKFDA